MQGLLLRLAALDAAAENAVRLITFFGGLADTVQSLQSLLSHAATIAECDVGLTDREHGIYVSANKAGVIGADPPPPDAVRRRVDTAHDAWIARPGAPLPLDELLLERLALACGTTIRRLEHAMAPTIDDPALLELAISPTAAATDRARAFHLLGLAPSAVVTVVAASGPESAVEEFAGSLRHEKSWTRHTRLSTVWLVMTTSEVDRNAATPSTLRLAVGPRGAAVEAPQAWQRALRALRLAEPGAHRVVHSADLGAFDLLAARLRSADITGVPDIDVLNELAADPASDLLPTIEVVVTTSSLRAAARRLHLHHNSVAARVARIEEALGYTITDPEGHLRVSLALALRRLARNDEQA